MIRAFTRLIFHRLSKPRILNASEATSQDASFENAKQASYEEVDIALQIRKLLSQILVKYSSDDGRTIDYAALSRSKEYSQFQGLVGKLRYGVPPVVGPVEISTLGAEGLEQQTEKGLDVKILTGASPAPASSTQQEKGENPTLGSQVSLEDARKSFFVNLYNALVIHAIIEESSKKATTNLSAPSQNTEEKNSMKIFYKYVYDINGMLFSLNDIEHGILRCNQRIPFTFESALSRSDPKTKYVLPSPIDPRIHFALNCGAMSCPPIRSFSAENINSGLTQATKLFLQDESNFKLVSEGNTTTIFLSQLLYWYGNDFGSTEAEILEWIFSYIDELDTRKQLLVDALSHSRSTVQPLAPAEQNRHSIKKLKIKYFPYNWSRNQR